LQNAANKQKQNSRDDKAKKSEERGELKCEPRKGTSRVRNDCRFVKEIAEKRKHELAWASNHQDNKSLPVPNTIGEVVLIGHSALAGHRDGDVVLAEEQ
jgi:hypothetical protein